MVLVPLTQAIYLNYHDQTQIQTIELCMLKNESIQNLIQRCEIMKETQ